MTLKLQTLANSMIEYALESWVGMGTGAGQGALSVSYRHNFLALLYLSKKIRLDVCLAIRTFTLKCLSIGTPKTINFPFVPNEKLTVFKCPKI